VKTHKLQHPLQYPKDDCQKKYDDGYFIDSMHHSQVVIGFLTRIPFFKYPEKIVAYLPQLEKLFNFLIGHNS
jgi:hypothetical protein